MKQAIARGQRGNGAMQLRSPAREQAVYGQGAARRETSLLLVLLYLRRVVAALGRPLLHRCGRIIAKVQHGRLVSAFG
ncbi:hypothetical protein [Xanthomonas hortorum]|uniref:hypothetical protein n=1 Tax=Xanthomonas hortorum TaxID=56454 RepID=UPI001F33FB7A|nr:hypothetical protein [Xanthomonas hortorum]MCE4358317.1 hypothetical protein [Xanthomonas hortorum pv. taraxaci]